LTSTETLSDLVLGPLREHLQRLHKKGKRHLCFVPHGGLHVAPLHLLADRGRLLAEDWLVTYLPTTWQLTRPVDPEPPPARTNGLTAIGASFQNDPRGLIPLGNVRAEVAAVAAACRGGALLDEHATKDAVLDALGRSRFVHIATHGAHEPAAGSYHTLYLTPGANDDGRLYAYELLGRDLRGLDLITLSACETALARYDPLGNPRGIPAALFQAGVRALVGTLWDIETDAAQTFFSRLYTCIGDGIRPSDAFLDAQRATRAKHPELRDWGAFYFTGDWR
jgi:CHAT domain-containing protein